MTKEIKYKLQSNGSDSWEISEYEGTELINRYMVSEKPEGWFNENDISEAKKFVKSKIDSKTQELIFKGFDFGGCHWSLSITAQINWSNLPNLPEMFFPLNIQDQNGAEYQLTFANRMNFYLTAVGAKNTPLQSGNALCKQVDLMTNINDVLNFVDPR